MRRLKTFCVRFDEMEAVQIDKHRGKASRKKFVRGKIEEWLKEHEEVK